MEVCVNIKFQHVARIIFRQQSETCPFYCALVRTVRLCLLCGPLEVVGDSSYVPLAPTSAPSSPG